MPPIPTTPGTSVTLADIARATGLNTASVSRALRGIKGKVSAETRQRVEQIAREMGYRPNAVAASLRTKQTNLVGIIVPDLANPLFGPIVQGLEAQLCRQGLLCLVVQTPQGLAERREVVLALSNRLVSGLVILAAEIDDPMLGAAQEAAMPVVLMNRGAGDRRFSSIVNDDHESVRLVLEHLADLGHRRVAHLAGPRVSSTGQARRQAFEILAKSFGLDARVVECSAFTREAGAAATSKLLAEKPPRPSAIFGANDLIALGALAVLRERGVSVPGEMSLVGHNDMPLMDLVAPPMTTVHVEVEQMSRQAAQMLVELLRDHAQAPSMRVLMPRLVVRESTAEVASAKAEV
ncbi:MAG: LacI family DNA-binding transcriptional regulator [Chitinophagaceae bacterium]|nr:LacI family DNA-binding transcriptional regulator [Rubrivivax sp.]